MNGDGHKRMTLGLVCTIRRCTRQFVAALFFILTPSVAGADDQLQNGLIMETQNAALMAAQTGDFAKLENMAASYRANDARMPNGGQQLEVFYDFTNWLFTREDRDEEFGRWEKIFADWKAAYPSSRTAIITHAVALVQYGWVIRGNDYAHKVWKEDWSGFENTLARAKKLLEANKAIASGDARWYSLMIGIEGATGANKDALWALAREGLQKDPRQFRIHSAMLYYLSPQWGGSPKLIQKWIDESVGLTKSTEGESLYARSFFNLRESVDQQQFLMLVDWPRLGRAVDDLLQRYPSVGNIETSIKVACLSLNPDEVHKRYAALVKVAGGRLPPTTDPAVQCNWPREFPRKQQPQPGVIDPEQLLNDRARDISTK